MKDDIAVNYEINSFVLGDFETNSYCLRADESAKDCLIIDTGLEAGPLVDYLMENELNPVAVIFTHGHADHITGVKNLRANWPDIKVSIHKNDAKMLTSCVKNISVLSGKTFTTAPADIIIDNDGPIEFAGIKLDVLHTPGHTQGGICLYSASQAVVFVGDTLFASSIGRTDLPGGNFDQLIAAIKEKLLALPDETKVFTGHGPATTIAIEKQFNQYLA